MARGKIGSKPDSSDLGREEEGEEVIKTHATGIKSKDNFSS